MKQASYEIVDHRGLEPDGLRWHVTQSAADGPFTIAKFLIHTDAKGFLDQLNRLKEKANKPVVLRTSDPGWEQFDTSID